jgi:GNAT superfamily N-acetyltransferase
MPRRSFGLRELQRGAPDDVGYGHPMSDALLIDEITAAHLERMLKIDPLIPAAVVPVVGSGSLIEVDGAIGVHKVADADPDSMGATWTELHRHHLSGIRLSGADPAEAMRRLLTAWQKRLRSNSSVLALRPARGLTVRTIEPGDATAVTELHLALARWDDHFGGSHLRPATPARMRDYVDELISSARPRAWVAETDGQILGTCDIEWPDTAGWISACVAADPAAVAYIGSASVSAGQRGQGVGSALITHVHHEMKSAGIRMPILHYSPLNPLAAPFWHRAGYRPLLTTWKAQPHTTLRTG